MPYDAHVKLKDTHFYGKDWELKGRAEKVLAEAIKFIGKKDSMTAFGKVIQYLKDDFIAFDEKMTQLFFGKNQGEK